MEKEDKKNFEDCKEWMKNHKHNHYGGSTGNGAVYCFGMIGAAIYYLQHSTTFMEGVIAILKSIVWPAFLIHKVFTLLGM